MGKFSQNITEFNAQSFFHFIYISTNRISEGSKVGKSLYSSIAGCEHGRAGRSGKHVGSRGSLQKQTPPKDCQKPMATQHGRSIQCERKKGLRKDPLCELQDNFDPTKLMKPSEEVLLYYT